MIHFFQVSTLFGFPQRRVKEKALQTRIKEFLVWVLFLASGGKFAIKRMIFMRLWLLTARAELVSRWKILLQEVCSAGIIDLKERRPELQRTLAGDKWCLQNSEQTHRRLRHSSAVNQRFILKSSYDCTFIVDICWVVFIFFKILGYFVYSQPLIFPLNTLFYIIWYN